MMSIHHRLREDLTKVVLNFGGITMNKITFMGAGSTVFVRNVLGDCMCSDALKDWEFSLYDIDPVRLQESYEIISAMNETKGGYGKVTAVY